MRKQPPRWRPKPKPGTVTNDGAVILADGTPLYNGRVWIIAGQIDRARRHGWRPMVPPFGADSRFIEVHR